MYSELFGRGLVVADIYVHGAATPSYLSTACVLDALSDTSIVSQEWERAT